MFTWVNKATFIVAFVFLLLFTKESSATHLMGSDLTYRCISKWKYEVTLLVYRDCNGNQLSTSQALRVECITNNSTLLFPSFSYKGKRDITPIDTAACNIRTKCGSGSGSTVSPYGIEEHKFTVTIDLSSYSCKEIRISWLESARNGSITTGAANQDFYTEALIYTNLAECNSSPIYTSLPTALICVGTDFLFNNGALDTLDKKDSLSYALVSPLKAKNSPISYSGQWNATRPVTFLGFPNVNTAYPGGFRLDSITGDISFRPTATNQVSVMVLEVTEWRFDSTAGTMKVIGKTRRDMQVIIINCSSNVPPVITGQSKETCPGERVCINITSSDANSGDSVRLSWNKGIPGATFTSSNGTLKYDTAQVCWTPSINEQGNIPYTFTITAKDDGCPLSGQSVKGFTIFVYEPPRAVQQVFGLGCGHVKVDFTPNKNYTGLKQTWIAKDTLGNVTGTSNLKQDTLHLPKGKAYITLILSIEGNCFTTYTDTLLIPEHVEVHAITSDTFACYNKQINVTSTIKDGVPPFNLVWNTSPNDTLPNLTLDTSKGAKYWVTVTDSIGCKWWDSVRVRWDTIPKVSFTNSTTCFKLPTSFTNNTIIGKSDTAYYTWRFGDNTSSNTISPTHLYTQQQDTLTVKLKAESDKGCKDSVSKEIYIWHTPTAAFTVDDTGQCKKNNLFTFTNQSTIGQGTMSYKWFFADGDSATTTHTTHSYKAEAVFKPKLIVTSNNQCKDSAFVTVDVFSQPQVGYSVNNATQCFVNNNFTFTNTSGIARGSITGYKWFFGDGDTSTQTNVSHKYLTPNTFSTSLVAYSDNGCIDTIGRTVNVFSMPTTNFVINDTSQCYKGNKFVFTNTSTIQYGVLKHSWSYGDGTPLDTNTHPQHSYPSDINYNVRLITTSAIGCTDTLIKTVYVRPMPVAKFTVNDTDQCQMDGPFSFTNQSTLKYGTMNYLWDFGNSTSGIAQDTSITYAQDGIFRARLRVTSDYNCTDTVGRYMLVFPKPNASFTTNDTDQCINTNYFINTNTSNIASGSMTYRWYFGTGDSSIALNANYKYSKDTVYTIALKTISNKNCLDTAYRQMLIFPKPKADFTVNDATQCLNTNFYEFTGTSTVKQGGLRYHWDFDNGRISAKKDDTVTYTNDIIYNVQLIAQSDFDCYDTITQPMTLYPVPKPAFAANDSDQCLNTNNYIFNNGSTIKYGSMTHEWTFDTEGSSSQVSPSFVFAKDTNYTVKLKVISDQLCTDSLFKTITVFTLPKPSFTVNDSAQCVNGDMFAFTNTSAIKYGNMQYKWFLGNGDSIAGTNANYGYDIDGPYTITLKATSNYGCIDSARRKIMAIPKPVAHFSIDDSSQCVSVGLFKHTNNSTIKYATNLHYLWNFDKGYTTTVMDTSISYDTNGRYNTVLIVHSDENCYDTFKRLMQVYPHPDVDFIVDNDSQCVGGNIFTFTNLTTIDSGAVDYDWYFGDGNTSTSISPAHSYAKDSSYMVWLKAVSEFGCSDSLEFPVEVRPAPKVTFAINDSGQCVNDNLFTFTNNSQIKYGNMTYFWDFGNGITSKKKDSSVVYFYDSTFSVLLKVTSNHGCIDSATRYLVVHSKPSPSFTVNDSDQCLYGQDFDFTNTSSIKTGSFTSLWTFEDGQTASATTQDVQDVLFNNPTPHKVKLVLTSDFSCKDSVENGIVVYPHPDPDFTGLKKYYCTDYDVVPLTPTVTGGTFTGVNMEGYNYNPKRLGLDTVLYNVVVNGCSNDTIKYTVVHPLPVLNLGADTTLCQKEPLYLDVSFPPLSTYLWHDGTTSPLYFLFKPGTYKVTLFNICDTLADEIKVTYRDYNCNYYFPTAFSPNDDGMNDIFLPYTENATQMHIEIYDRWGGKVFESTEPGQGWNGRFPNGEMVPIGVYIWQITLMFDNKGFVFKHSESGTVTLVR